MKLNKLIGKFGIRFVTWALDCFVETKDLFDWFLLFNISNQFCCYHKLEYTNSNGSQIKSTHNNVPFTD